ncbi:hypothetical protein AMAG_12647 [Allomyces macrogynus ATCC 38327]|uniref:Uncharacterized protein n=1 Tax=Allomyces macrogynus (strain ATCC 38327) TaxID=578462 RepID=A0A0L0T1H6_ALLM3|nr:hypothetical protein AMAG_12647 [Allomyces macrogynus ATCC 38327]|eukprot:KNE68470.1 hypothetical protein AMAG_12647 [Allomyces macrogynus ATCC 38327]
MSSAAVPPDVPTAAPTPPLPPAPPRPPPAAGPGTPVAKTAAMDPVPASSPVPALAPAPAPGPAPVPTPAAAVVLTIPPLAPAPQKPAARRHPTPGTQPPPRKKPRANARAKAAAASGAGGSASDGSAGASIPPAGLASPSPTATSTPPATRTTGSGRGGRSTGQDYDNCLAETDDDVPRHLAAVADAARAPPTHFLRSRTDGPTDESSTPVAAAAEACLALATWAPVGPPPASDPHLHPAPPGPPARARSRSDMHFAAPAPAVYSLLAQYPGFYPAPAPTPAPRPPNGGFHAHAHATAVQQLQPQVPAWGIQSPDPTPLASPTLATDTLPRWPATAAVHGSIYAPVAASVDATAVGTTDPAAAYLSPWHDRALSTSSLTSPWPAAAVPTAPAPTVFSTATPSRAPTSTITHAPVLFDPAVVTCSVAMPHAHYAFPNGLVPARIPTPTLTPAAPIVAAAAPPSSTGSSSPHVHAIPAPPHHHLAPRPRLPTGPVLSGGLHMRSDTAATVVEDIAAAAIPPPTLSDAPSECAEDVDEDVHLAPVRVPDDDARPVALPRLPALAQLVAGTSPRMTPAAAPRSSPLVVRGSSARLGGSGGARSPPEPGVGAARVAS